MSSFETSSIEGKFRIAFVSPVGDIGGAERVIAAISSGLAERSIDHRIFCLREGDWTLGNWSSETKVVAFPGGYRIRQPFRLWKAVRWLRRQFKDYRPTIIHANHGGWWLTAMAARGMTATKIWHLYDYPDRKDIQVLAGERLPPSGVIFTGEYVGSGHPSLMRLPHAFIRPVTLEPAQFAQGACDDHAVDRVIRPGERYLLNVARWQPHKGFRYLVDVVQLLQERARLPSDLRVVIIGKPANREQELFREEIFVQMRAKEVFDRFVFVESCSDSGLRAFYRRAVTLVHPSTTEGFGLTLIEAMSMGTPVIACDASGPSEILDHGRYGCLISKGDASKLSDAIERMLFDQAFRSKMRLESLERAKAFSKERMISETLAFYARLAPEMA
jgi:glycosyltransferase involved in cell wall biosynthesis